MDMKEFVLFNIFCFHLGNLLTDEVVSANIHSTVSVKTHRQSARVRTLRTAVCPRQCRCYLINENLKTDCSNAKLNQIPNDVSRDTTILLLNNNRISANMTHPLNLGLLAKLEYLDLSYNKISSLSSHTFSGLSNLKYLSLAFNLLQSAECLSKNVFRPLRVLKELDIHGNCDSYSENQCSYHDRELGKLPTLERLVMDGFLVTNLGPGFRNLIRLRYLKLHSSYCRLKSVTVLTFRNLESSNLETLDLTECHLDEVKPYSFGVFKHLKTLILSGNDNLCTEGLRNASIGLNATKIENLILKNTCNHIQTFQGNGPFSALKNTKLLKLDLERCKILNMSLDFIFLLPKSLLYLSMRDNKIISGLALLAIPYMPNLEYLDGSGQSRYHVSTFKNRLSTNLEPKAELREILSAYCSRNAYEVNGTNKLHIPKIHVQNQPEQKHIPWPSVISLPPKLKFLNASFLPVNSYIPSINFSAKNSLELWDFSNTLLKGSCGKIYGLHNLKYLNLSFGMLSYLDPFTFGDMKELCEINLRGNPLGKAMAKSSELLFSNQSHLMYLDLSSTSLKQLPWKIFGNNKDLKVLNLANNFFETITFSLESLTSLEMLDLSHNSIKHISPEVARQLSQISTSFTIEVNLEENSLQCTCNYKPFVHWLADLGGNIRFSNNQTLKCLYNNNTEVKVMSLKYMYRSFDIECFTWVIMTSCVIGFLFLLVLFGSSAYVYTQRWKLRYLYYIGRKSINPYHPLLGEEVNLINDVYISFDESAIMLDGTAVRYFVTAILYSRLEEKQFVVKIRDELESEKPLYDTISQTVRACRRVLVFLSKDYCKEFWNVFEFNMAAYEGIYTSRDVIIPIILEDVSPRDLSGEIKAFVSNRQIMQLKSDTNLNDFLEKLELKIRR